MLPKQNPKGMSLIEVMVTIGVAAIVMLALANSMSSMFKTQSTVIKKDIGNEFMASFSNMIHQSDICGSYLAGVRLRPGDAPVNLNFQDYITSMTELARTKGDATLDDLAEGGQVDEGVYVAEFTIQNSSLPDSDVHMDGVDYYRRVAEIKLRLAMKIGDVNREMKARHFQVPVLVDKTNDTIHSCAGGMTLDQACLAMGSADTDGDGECDATTSCFVRGTYTTVSCKGSVRPPMNCTTPILNQFTGGSSCLSPAVAVQSGTSVLNYPEDCGKKCTNNVEENITFYICMECS